MSTDDIMQHPANKLSTLSGWGKKNSVTPQTVKAWYDKSVKDGTAPTPFFEEGGTRVFSTLQIEELREKYGQKPKAADAQALRIADIRIFSIGRRNLPLCKQRQQQRRHHEDQVLCIKK